MWWSSYMTTLGNKRVELFDMGGASEPTADENVQVASGTICTTSTCCLYFHFDFIADDLFHFASINIEMSNQQLIDAGMSTMDETDQAIERSKQVQ